MAAGLQHHAEAPTEANDSWQSTHLQASNSGMASRISSISQALAGNADTVAIPTPSVLDAKSTYGSGNNMAFGASKAGHSGLPTPPNSISPNLPEAFRAKFAHTGPDSPPSVDSDIDLQDAGDHAGSQDRAVKSEDEEDFGAGNLTPAYLAKHHLADLVLNKGPIAIRHIIDHLNENVPGFNQIAPPKARRLTVSALETKNGGGQNSNVEFEKVGWGRWDAKIKWQPSREARSIYAIREDPLSLPHTDFALTQPSLALQIPRSDKPRVKSRRLSSGSWTAESTVSSRSARADRMDVGGDVAEYGADAMSVDGEDEYSGQTYRPSISYQQEHQEWGSDTDEEDWSQMGAEALRDGFGTSGPRRGSNATTSLGSYGRSRSRGWSPYPRSLSIQASSHTYQRQQRPQPQLSSLDFTGTNLESQQERDAIEALLRMGSM